jgi:hypothetical protein
MRRNALELYSSFQPPRSFGDSASCAPRQYAVTGQHDATRLERMFVDVMVTAMPHFPTFPRKARRNLVPVELQPWFRHRASA